MTDPFVTSVKVDTKGGHDTVWVFVEGKCVGQLVCGLGHGERLQNVLLSEKYFGTGRTPDGPIDDHERMAWRVMATQWLDVQDIICGQPGIVGRMVLRLLDRVQELEDEHERATNPPPAPPAEWPSLVDVLKLKGQKLFIEDVPWFVKDFHVLYKAANDFVQRMDGVRDAAAQAALNTLVAQLARLAPAYKETEAVRATAVQRSNR